MLADREERASSQRPARRSKFATKLMQLSRQGIDCYEANAILEQTGNWTVYRSA